MTRRSVSNCSGMSRSRGFMRRVSAARLLIRHWVGKLDRKREHDRRLFAKLDQSPVSLLLRRRVPVLGDLSVLDAEHVEPCRRVLLRRVLRVARFANETQDDQITVADHSDQRRLDPMLDGFRYGDLRK